ncbi:hypothetical protein BAXH7_04034 [Bacillus amyloliquefaciens XH7]|nr:hypothetical protein LL3_04039 [Bacillus amyloliquefaciens LL3]AEK91142.1 hypothetical protein BAXH7_04034 [Bacillus amyloliquefaciens XH7]KYC98711.1 hypothetical protein B425_3174 [Bacillus amyloliquefaciens]
MRGRDFYFATRFESKALFFTRMKTNYEETMTKRLNFLEMDD